MGKMGKMGKGENRKERYVGRNINNRIERPEAKERCGYILLKIEEVK